MSNAKRWTCAEDARLLSMHASGSGARWIGRVLNRSEGAIKSRLAKHRFHVGVDKYYPVNKAVLARAYQHLQDSSAAYDKGCDEIRKLLSYEHGVKRRTDDRNLAECPLCGSLDVGGAHGTVSCYGCGLQITMPAPLQNAIDAWNTFTERY